MTSNLSLKQTSFYDLGNQKWKNYFFLFFFEVFSLEAVKERLLPFQKNLKLLLSALKAFIGLIRQNLAF